MKWIPVFVLALAALLSGCTAPAEAGVEVRDAWSRPAVQGGNGAVYFVIVNRSKNADMLTGAVSDVAEAVEIHESTMSGDVMEMHHMPAVALAPGEEVIFEPGGLHVMLIGLKRELKAGDEVDITLQFEDHEDLTLRASVQEPGP